MKYYEAEKLLENNNKKNLKRYTKGKFIKQRKKRPLAFISSPIISKNGMHAIVYSSYVCGGLCGSGSVQFFKKLNNEWIIDKHKIRWIS